MWTQPQGYKKSAESPGLCGKFPSCEMSGMIFRLILGYIASKINLFKYFL